MSTVFSPLPVESKTIGVGWVYVEWHGMNTNGASPNILKNSVFTNTISTSFIGNQQRCANANLVRTLGALCARDQRHEPLQRWH